tara:strand:+ start:90 stop:575 length:486 start_codon:yes stop_codon:yes gene_type:complete
MDLSTFDAQSVPEDKAFSLLPADWYRCVITGSEERPTKANLANPDDDSSYLNLTFQVLEGDYTGRLVWDLLNLKNNNPTAVQIAQGTLSSICKSVGINNPQNSSDLHDKPLLVKIGVDPEQNGYPAKNRPMGYKAAGGASAAPAVTGTASNGAASPPWAKK